MLKQAGKNKKKLKAAENYQRVVDTEFRDYLLDYFLQNVCNQYCRYRFIMWTEAKKIQKKLMGENQHSDNSETSELAEVNLPTSV